MFFVFLIWTKSELLMAPILTNAGFISTSGGHHLKNDQWCLLARVTLKVIWDAYTHVYMYTSMIYPKTVLVLKVCVCVCVCRD